METKYVAVVVTFNRLALLKNCIESLKSQTKKIDAIIVVNNGSNDGTREWLNEQDNLTVLHQENLGGAGGFHEGIKFAYEKGYEWIWIMDDDCFATQDCLSSMVSSLGSQKLLAVAPLVVDKDGKADLNHRGYFNFSNETQNIQIPLEAINSNDLLVDFCSFVGLMINATAVKKIGLPIKEFFIHNDDVEYCIRLSKVSRILLSTNARIFHLENALNTDIEKKFLSHSRFRTPMERLWIRYYGMRNLIWMRKKYMYNGSVRFKATFIFYLLKTLAAHLKDVTLYDDNKVKRYKFYANAYWDGWNGKFDNNKPKSILNYSKK